MLTDEQMIEKARARGIADKASALFFGRTIETLVIDAERAEYRRLLQLQRVSWERGLVLDVEAEREACAKDSKLLRWLVTHPETAAECSQDAAAGDGEARANLEFRMDALRSNV